MVVTAVVWTNGWHKLFWGQMVVQHVGEFLMLHGRGPGFWINIGYTYVVLGAGLVLLLRHALHSPYLYRRRAAILVVGTIVPWVGNAVFILQPGEHILDPTPFLFTCTALVAALAVFRYELFEPAPTLRDARIEAVGDGVIILDGRGRIADLNASAEAILARRRGEAAGTQSRRCCRTGRPALANRRDRSDPGHERQRPCVRCALQPGAEPRRRTDWRRRHSARRDGAARRGSGAA